jgi:hypothetical protein
MLRTPLCDVLGIDVPIILAPMGSASSAEFAPVGLFQLGKEMFNAQRGGFHESR